MENREANQAAFEKVVRHLLRQGRQSLAPTGQCRYREGGLMCAIGSLIPDEEYSEALEGKSVTTLLREDRLPPSLSGLSMKLLVALQNAHDLALGPWDIRPQLEVVASNLSLTMPDLESAP